MDITHKLDAIMVIDPKRFPAIEIRVISKDRDGSSPQLVDSITAKYVRGHHQGGGGQFLKDAIVLPNGNYLLNVATEDLERRLMPESLDPEARKLYFKSNPGLSAFFTEMKPTGYSAGRSFSVTEGEPESVMPKVHGTLPGWKDAEIHKNEKVIQLGYDKGCDQSFGRLPKK